VNISFFVEEKKEEQLGAAKKKALSLGLLEKKKEGDAFNGGKSPDEGGKGREDFFYRLGRKRGRRKKEEK